MHSPADCHIEFMPYYQVLDREVGKNLKVVPVIPNITKGWHDDFSHEADPEDIMKMNFHGVILEIVIGGKIPAMTSEHCFIGDSSSCNKNSCSKNRYFLEDRKGAHFQLYRDPKTCANIIFSHKEANNLKEKLGFNKAIKHFRIYVI